MIDLLNNVKVNILNRITVTMKSKDIRTVFLNFFKDKNHHIVSSAPMVVKNDPTLMFTNAGMNQFKDFFLGNENPPHKRVANSQKCLRVSGKHNDLEEVGHDTYHHTMFEMLGNWSFGNYFKQEAIEWAWEFLTEVCKIDKKNLYVTVFGGDTSDKLEADKESYDIWKNILPAEKILYGAKKDNFWEMGDTGPCGPCSEIHIDIREEKEKLKLDGKELVNKDHPLVIEIWNLVFIEYNRKANGALEKLKNKHVDTGMGFERLCMVLQGVESNYDTDCFTPLLKHIEKEAAIPYGQNEKQDIAMRVIADHLRAVSFAVADGQLPSNVKAGYVIRRILRRAIRYAYVFLGIKEPFIHNLVDTLSAQMGEAFPELLSQKDFVKTIIEQEEKSFLKTLALGLAKFENYIKNNAKKEEKLISGSFAFELYDTYGFPVDLTVLMAKEMGWKIDIEALEKCMKEQKERSKKASNIEISDWVDISPQENTAFVGYEKIETNVKIIKFRKVTDKSGESYQLVFDKTPFYAEAGGQVGDTGSIESEDEKVAVINTVKENNLIIHLVKELPKNIKALFIAKVDRKKRFMTAANHSATHLLHAALKEVLGEHIEQKGSLVTHKRLRFDFSHYERMTDEEITKVEALVNKKIRENIPTSDIRDISYNEALKMGAVALFGEKYADKVRLIAFDEKFSIELCGGTHVKATGEIALFKIISESAIAAGTRRIEAVTGQEAINYLNKYVAVYKELTTLLNKPLDLVKAVTTLIDENVALKKEIEGYKNENVKNIKKHLLEEKETINGIIFIGKLVDLDTSDVKNLAFQLKAEHNNLFLLLGVVRNNKINLTLMISESLVKERQMDASKIIKNIAKEVKGGGGGQAFFATAGGSHINGFDKALSCAKSIVEQYA